MRLRFLVTVPGIVLTVACRPARAPQPTTVPSSPQAAPPPTSLPAPLVTALIESRGSAARPSPDYAVGRLPRGYPARLVPSKPARVIGGMSTNGQIVAVFADSTRRLAAILEDLFEHEGFTRPAPVSGAGFSSGSGPYSFFCGDSGTVLAEPLGGMNRDFVRVTYQPMGGRGACQPARATQLSRLALPELRPPEGVWVMRSHGGSDVEGVNSSAEMSGTTLVPSTILAHYSNQLVAAGWTAAAPAISERVAAQFFTAKDTSGGIWEGVLMAAGSRTKIEISLAMHAQTNR